MRTSVFAEKMDFVKTIPIETFLTSRGGVYNKSNTRNSAVYYCPYHSDTSKPNLLVTISKNICHCFACGFGGDVIGCESYIKYGKPSKELDKTLFINVVESLYDEYCGKDLTPFRGDSYLPSEEEYEYKRKVYANRLSEYKSARLAGLDRSSIEYITKRGIDLVTAEIYGLSRGTVDGIPQVIIPMRNNSGEIVALKYRRNDLLSLEGNRYYIPTTSDTKYPYVLNPESSEKIFFCEDSFSALAVRSLGFPSASLFTGNKIPYEGKPYYINSLKNKRIVIIPDNDDAGKTVIEEMRELLGKYIPYAFCANGAKDFSEMVEKDKSLAYQFLIELWRNDELFRE